MITDSELWEQAAVMWDALPEIKQHSLDCSDWQDGFVAGCKLFIERMRNRGLNDQDVRRVVGMDV